MAPLFSNFLTRQRLKTVVPYLDGEILDLGCGYGHLIKYLKPGQSYVGVDGNKKTLAWLNDHYPALEFHLRDLESQELRLERQFDRIFMVALIEHLNHPEILLSQIPAHLKPDGKLIITTPTSRGGRLHKLGARLGLTYSEAAEDHKKFFDYAALNQLLESNLLVEERYSRFLLGENQLIVGVLGPTKL